MASFTFKGMKEYEAIISKMYADTAKICGRSIYAAAGIVADEIRSGIEQIPAKPDKYALIAYQKKWQAPITETQKKGLADGFGISPLQEEDGYWNVKLGFDGYNGTKTKKFPKGQPNQLVARSIESGTSAIKKYPFVRPAVARSQKRAVEAMQKVIDADLTEKMKG